MEAVCSRCQKPFISQSKDSKILQYYRMCETCRSRK